MTSVILVHTTHMNYETTKLINRNLHIPGWGSSSSVFISNSNLELLGFEEGEKPENPKKNSRSKNKNQQQTQSTCDARHAQDSNPGHIGERRVLLTTALSCSPEFISYKGKDKPEMMSTYNKSNK